MGRKEIFWQWGYSIFAKYLAPSYRSNLSRVLRYYFAKKIINNIGKNVNVEKGARFTGKITVGDYSGLGVNCDLSGDVIIGKYVMMGPEVAIYSKNHNFVIKSKPMMLQGYTESKPVIIEDNVWIGRRVIVLPGVTLGEGCIVGAGAIVTKNVKPFTIVAGNPAKFIGNRFEQQTKT